MNDNEHICPKLYTALYKTYGTSYTVAAISKEHALKSIQRFICDNSNSAMKEPAYHYVQDSNGVWHGKNAIDGGEYIPYEWEKWMEWEKATPDKLPEGYSWNIKEKGEVFVTEAS